jgi:hypothetical protein
MAHLTDPRYAPALRKLTPPPEYALVWRATLAAAGLYAQLGATVPTRAFHLAYSPGFRNGHVAPEPPPYPNRFRTAGAALTEPILLAADAKSRVRSTRNRRAAGCW